MGLTTPEKIRKFQRKLYRRAKQNPARRFHSLYDKICREDILERAYRRCRAKGKAPGVDGTTFEEIEEEGREEWLEALREELVQKEYEPAPVKRVEIEKTGGGMRPLGIPTVKDRVVQMAAKMVIEPIFEADFHEQVLGYRPERSVRDALKRVHTALQEGKTEVVDADLSSYFDTIPHNRLLDAVAERISDGTVLALVKGWLKVPVRKRNENGNWIMTGGKSASYGTPQGGVISPLLANIYMNQLLEAWEEEGAPEEYRAEFVNYADDFVIATEGNAKEALDWVKEHVESLGLELNEEKTKIRDVDREKLDFLGYTFKWRMYKPKGKMYLGATPSRESLDRFKEKVRSFLSTHQTTRWKRVLEMLRRKLVGWVNHHSYGSTYERMRELRRFLYDRLKWYLRRTGQKVGGSLLSYLTVLLKSTLNPHRILKKIETGSVWDLL